MRKKYKYSDKFFCCCLIALACYFGVFYAKYANYGDIPAHTIIAKEILFLDAEYDGVIPEAAYAYPLYHLAQKAAHLALGVDYEAAAALCLSISIAVSVLLYRKLALMIAEDTVANRYFCDFISLGAVLFGLARCRLNDWHYYAFSCAANPFHNPTALFVRPFAIGSFICFLRYRRAYGRTSRVGPAAGFSVLTLLSVLAKPSYAIVFLPAMGVYTLYDMVRRRDLMFGIGAFLAVLSSLAALAAQLWWTSTETVLMDIGFRFGSFMELDGLEVFLASVVTFPVVILLFRIYRGKGEPVYFIAIAALIAGWCQMFFINDMSGNFSWGYDIAVQFATLVSLAETRNGESRGMPGKFVNGVAYAIFLYQVATGMQYLGIMYRTTNYNF